MTSTESALPGPRTGVAVALGLAAAKLLLHLATNLWAGYGIFRDELYYLACADHPAWGYVDQPPLSIALLAVQKATLGAESLFTLRLVPAVAGAAAVLFTVLIAREMGGGRFAQLLAGLAALAAPIQLGYVTVYSMNSLDLALVAAALFLFTRLLRTGDAKLWIGVGLLIGLALLNKVGALWIGAGVAVGLVATRERRWLRTPWPWAAGLLAAAIFAPYLLWNAAHGWPHLEFMEQAMGSKYAGVTRTDFVAGQLLLQGPMALPIWLAGLAWLLVSRRARPFRPLAWVWLTAFAVLLAAGHSKAEYLATAYAAVFGAGGIAWEGWLAGPRSRRLRPVLAFALLAGLLLAPAALPILPVDSYVRWARAMGLQPGTAEGHELAELPQFYADMFGWPEKAEAVAAVWRTLPEEDRSRAAIFTTNYGRAGAIDHFGRELGLPRALSSHNNYWLWGPGDATGEIVVVLGLSREDLSPRFASVERAGTADCELCIPYERDVPIWIARGPLQPLADVWPEIRSYN